MPRRCPPHPVASPQSRELEAGVFAGAYKQRAKVAYSEIQDEWFEWHFNMSSSQGHFAQVHPSLIYFLISNAPLQECELCSHVFIFFFYKFSAALLAPMSHFSCPPSPLLSFLSPFPLSVCLPGRGQTGSQEGSQGGGQGDPHEGAGEATERGAYESRYIDWLQ